MTTIEKIRAEIENTIDKEKLAFDGQFDKGLNMALKIIDKYAEQEKTGMWFLTIEDWNKWTCSECGFSKRTDIHVMIRYNYCPNCGARLIESEEEYEPQESEDKR